jgi:hypothetical protein
MTRRREQIVLDLQKLAAELRQATPTVAGTKLKQIDERLDECLDEKGAHPGRVWLLGMPQGRVERAFASTPRRDAGSARPGQCRGMGNRWMTRIGSPA